MPYLTEDGYKKRFGAEELEQVLASDDELTFADALVDAQSIVDGYLAAIPGRVFVVPLASAVPVRVTELTADLVRYELHGKKVTHEMKRRRNEAIEFLEACVAGKAAIPELLPDGGAAPVVIGGADYFAEERVFTSSTLSGYVGR